jgi:hypothetical protein
VKTRARGDYFYKIESIPLVRCANMESKWMMQDMMSGGMTWGMGLFGVACLVVFLLLIAALVKFVFYR